MDHVVSGRSGSRRQDDLFDRRHWGIVEPINEASPPTPEGPPVAPPESYGAPMPSPPSPPPVAPASFGWRPPEASGPSGRRRRRRRLRSGVSTCRAGSWPRSRSCSSVRSATDLARSPRTTNRAARRRPRRRRPRNRVPRSRLRAHDAAVAVRAGLRRARGRRSGAVRRAVGALRRADPPGQPRDRHHHARSLQCDVPERVATRRRGCRSSQPTRRATSR